MKRLLMICGGLLLAGNAWLIAQDEPIRPTVITSESLEMQGSESKNYFYFRNNVEVKGTNLELSCDELTVIANRGGEQDETIGKIGAIEKIIAQGHVEIYQAGRTAFAGRAEVIPSDGTVTLSDSPTIIDDDVKVEGYQFVLHRGEKKFESIPDPNAKDGEKGRSIVRLGALPDLGFDQKEEDITVDDKIDNSQSAAQPEAAESSDEETSSEAPENGQGASSEE